MYKIKDWYYQIKSGKMTEERIKWLKKKNHN